MSDSEKESFLKRAKRQVKTVVLTLAVAGTIAGAEKAGVLPKGQDPPHAGASEVQWSKWLCTEVCRLDAEVHAEYRLPNGKRVDIYDPAAEICWEVEWCAKADAAFGQAARYAQQTGTTAGVWLLKESEDDEAYLEAILSLDYFEKHGVRIPCRVTKVLDGTTLTIRTARKVE
ncbi:hypothetical protein KOR42_22860 [Thalassoglobus neptunius]|uniref:Uncharacterized protein n=1 Tax=Thalassoglobus neptunius TaxID=1938619 RepID=A0A5C5X865_9PLAN|nr:hypothetical protein [Thalassoglobus neptunius]TWT58899.1 hypothetical protein KOR42_22860 [Thalassoglobus neptunius]